MDDLVAWLQTNMADFGLKLAVALVIFVLGRWVAMLITRLVRKAMERAKLEKTLIAFTEDIVYVALLLFVVLAALSHMGLQTASLIAVIGAAGLAVGLALQGSLANFAAGALLVIFRPFRVGDLIEGSGELGVVEKIEIFTTQIRKLDNKTVIIPNAKLTTDNIINYSAKGQLRVDMVIGVSYSADIDQTRKVIQEVIEGESRVLKDPAPTIGVLALADSSVNFAVRPWVNSPDYWPVWFELTEKIKKALDAADITIPFPQRDVHLYSHHAETAGA
ncbi:MAG: mechanosensitive ion channel [Phycisphaeraceae bacterium]|nr:mechanosensitive ion channel [Phycisphaeraceae bacterium]